MTDRITLPTVSDDDNRTLNMLLEQLESVQADNLLRAGYYDGKRAVRQVGTVIPPQYYRLGIVLGWSAKAVDALARRCNLGRFVWPDGDLDSLGAADVWDGNYLKSEANSGIISSLMYGPAFVVTTRGDESAGEPPALIHFKDALSATGEWNARARRLNSLLSVLGRDDDGHVNNLALYLDGVTVVAERVGPRWSVDKQPHPWGVPAELLPYKPRMGRPFGSSRISRPVMGLQDQATRAVIRLEGHMDVYSYPEMWMLGADESIFRNADGTLKPSWQVMLGRIKGIPDDDEQETPRADVKQFPASNPTPHLAGLNAIAKMFAREASLPDTALAITDMANPTSSEAYDASQYELIAEAEGATDDWTPALRRSFARALAVANGLNEVPEAWRSIDAKWRDPRYQSRAAEADAGTKQLSAVPWLAETEVGLELLGLDELQIRRALADRRRLAGSAALQAIQAIQAAAERVAGERAVTVAGGDAAGA